MDYSPPVSPVHGFPRQEYWSGLPFSSAGDLLPPGDWTSTSCLAGRFFSTELSSVQFSRSVMSDSLQPHGLQHTRPPCPHQLPEFTQTHVHWVSDAIQPSHILSSPSPPTFNLSQHQGLFQWVSFCIRWPKYYSFSFNISPSKEHSGLIFFRDWLDLLAIQGTRKSLLQHHSSKASILQHSAFFIVQLSHPYMTTGKTIAPLSYPSLNIP